ncbi:MAG: HAD family hydrolase [Clostridia bacterium]|nr:HAD family hydrolase [Clostridia bacterium]
MKTCIFDLDGTLTDTIAAIAHFGNLALSECGFSTFETERYKVFVGDGRTKLIERMLEAQDALTEENFKAVCTVYDRYYEADPLYNTHAYEGIKELLEELKNRGVTMAVCSNKPDNVAQDVIKTVFGDGYFSVVSGVVDGGYTKPDKRYTESILKRLFKTADECIFIGDTNVDILTGKGAGIETIGVLWGFRDRAELESAGADHIISKPSEILDFI